MNDRPPTPAPETWPRVARALAATAAEPVDLAPVDGPALLPFAVNHGVAPLLDQRLAEGAVTGVSQNTASGLREEAHREAALDLAQGHATLGLGRVLEDNGFDFLLLKGATLGRRIYPEGRLRPRCDTDLWIRAEEAGAVAEALRTFGYTLVNAELNSRSRKQYQVFRERFQDEPLWFDVHHRLSNRTHFMHALGFEECLDDATPLAGFPESEEVPPTLLGPPNPHLLLHLCIHRLGHGRGSDRDRMIWLYDIHLLWRAMDAGERLRFTDLALDRGLGCLSADALATAREAFGTGVSDKRLEQLSSRRKTEPTARLLRSGKWGWAWSDLQGQAGLRDRLRFIGELLRNRLGKG